MFASALHSSPNAASTSALLSVVVSGLYFSLMGIVDSDALDERLVIRLAGATVLHVLASAAALDDPAGVSVEARVDVWVGDVTPVGRAVGELRVKRGELGWLVALLRIVDVASDFGRKQVLRDLATCAEDVAKVGESHATASAHCNETLCQYGSSAVKVGKWARKHTDGHEAVKFGIGRRH